jgi:hypothetical protein
MRPYQVLSDCPTCRVEAALVELMDPSERIPVTIEGRCRLCGYATQLGEVTNLGAPFVSPEDVIDALRRWAAEDNEPDVATFTASNFGGLTPGAVAARVLAGERVETGFDVIAYLFPGMAGGSSASRAVNPVEGPAASTGWVHAPPPAKDPDPRDITRALVSILAADGGLAQEDRPILEREMVALNARAIPGSEVRVWRPNEIGPIADPPAVIEAMRRLALATGEPDESERRVLREYAAAWGVPLPAQPLPSNGTASRIARSFAGLFVR